VGGDGLFFGCHSPCLRKFAPAFADVRILLISRRFQDDENKA